jgi:hypothetical protein
MKNASRRSLPCHAEIIGRDISFYLDIMPAVSKRDANEKQGNPVIYL